MKNTHTQRVLALLLVGVACVMTSAHAAQPPVSTDGQTSANAPEESIWDTLPAWLRNMKISGDVRYRHERAMIEDAPTRDRDRLRARLVFSTEVNDEVNATIGVATGTNDSATNTNQDLTGAFSSKNLWLDQAFVDYHPAKVEGLNVFAGKMKNPYDHPGNSDILFDTDVTPEGIVATYKRPLAENAEFTGVVGGHYVQERSTSVDTSLWVAQAAVTCKVAGGAKIKAGAGYFTFVNIQGQTALASTTDNFRGNTSVADTYASDFDIFRTFGEVDFPVSGQPCAAFGELLINTGAVGNQDTGFLLGASVGKCKAPGSWQVAYNYRDQEADCMVASLVDSTFAGGGTGVKGHKLSVGYQVAKNWVCNLNYMMGERVRAATTDYDVLQFEFNFKF